LIGEAACDFGVALLQFALGVWVYERTGSPQQFVWVFLSSSLPALVLAPLAGALGDQVNRRLVILLTDVATASVILSVAALLAFDRLRVPYLYCASSVAAALGCLRTPSYQAAMSDALARESLTRATGVREVTTGIIGFATPLLAGGMMAGVGLRGVLLVILATMALGTCATFSALGCVPATGRTISRAPGLRLMYASLRGLSPALEFLRQQPLMLALLLYTVIHGGLVALVSVMLTPLILATHSSAALGVVSACGAAGAVAGAGLIVVVNPRRRLMSLLLLCNACLALCMVVVGLNASFVVRSVCVFAGLMAGSASDSCSTALWMSRAPRDVRGSIFALLSLLRLLAVSSLMFGGSVIVERVFVPALAAGGGWAGAGGVWLGPEKGRALALLFVLSGSICGAVSLAAFARPRMRRFDELVSGTPDVAVSN
jgi:diaminobutyrate-2-oxoglutarate transaminase